MSEFKNKDLDKLFQQGLEEHNFEYNFSAWTQMESLLDKDEKTPSYLVVAWRYNYFNWYIGDITNH